MNSLYDLILENNMMLKLICQYLVNKEKVQDTIDINNNIIGDWLAEYLITGK